MPGGDEDRDSADRGEGPTSSEPVRAAGVVLVRGSAETPEVALVHRARRDDWSLPKGKIDPGEHVISAAVRECWEETGMRPVLSVPLPSQEYLAFGRPKTVDYWSARIGDAGSFEAGEEVDEVSWLDVESAAQRLTYPRDTDLVRLATALPDTVPLVLLRHAQAVKRADFPGSDDAKRPLTRVGKEQARELVPLLSAFGVVAVHSSDTARCQDTVRRLARSLDTDIVDEPSLSERGHADKPRRAARRMQQLLAERRPLVVCSHRPVMPTLVEAIAGLRITGPLDLDPRLPPGAFLVVHRAFDEGEEPTVLAVERHTL